MSSGATTRAADTQRQPKDPSAVQVVTAVPTPFLPDGAFVAGTAGEFTALEDAERLAVIEAGLGSFGVDRVYAHVGAGDARAAERLTRQAVDLGARNLAAVTPYYFPAPLDAVLGYFERVVAAAGGAEVYAYLFTARTTTTVPPEALSGWRRWASPASRSAVSRTPR